jgi:hypothetical protein
MTCGRLVLASFGSARAAATDGDGARAAGEPQRDRVEGLHGNLGIF